MTFQCSNGVYDDNGHGTATAAIAAGANVANGSSMMGVAPSATIVAEKVLNASGSGTDLDVANGITKAVNAGAQVINLSLTYLPTNSVINAINYAASKGVIIVFAGGNSSAPLNNNLNSTGLTAAALSHLAFAGSVSSSNQLSSFSNTPGTGSAVATTTQASYASLWLMAPGENIVAPGIQFGPNALAYWTGTSMAAPIVTGALALLETTWPILQHNGTATAVLFATATDLGTVGVDTKFGNGLIDLTRAFQPVGTLKVTEANGQSIAVTSLTGTMVTAGALGSLTKVSTSLSNYTAFDTFARNYYVNLSPLLTIKTSIALSNLQVFGPVVTGGEVALPNGGHLFFAHSDAIAAPGSGWTDRFASVDYGTVGAPPAKVGAWLMSYASVDGAAISVGRGFSAAPLFSAALWGDNTAHAAWAQTSGQPNDFLSLASGGTVLAVGNQLGSDTRIAFGVASSSVPEGFGASFELAPRATAESVGITTGLARGWTIGADFQFLREDHGLLGTNYSDGTLSFGRTHSSMLVGLSTTLELARDTDLVADASIARVSRFGGGSGIVTGSSPLLARSAELGLIERNVFDDLNSVSLTVAKPLRVIAGYLDVFSTTVDAQGLPVYTTKKVGLTPDGDETDVSIGYERRIAGSLYLNAVVGVQKDAGNISGNLGGLMRLRLNIAL